MSSLPRSDRDWLAYERTPGDVRLNEIHDELAYAEWFKSYRLTIRYRLRCCLKKRRKALWLSVWFWKHSFARPPKRLPTRDSVFEAWLQQHGIHLTPDQLRLAHAVVVVARQKDTRPAPGSGTTYALGLAEDFLKGRALARTWREGRWIFLRQSDAAK